MHNIEMTPCPLSLMGEKKHNSSCTHCDGVGWVEAGTKPTASGYAPIPFPANQPPQLAAPWLMQHMPQQQTTGQKAQEAASIILLAFVTSFVIISFVSGIMMFL